MIYEMKIYTPHAGKGAAMRNRFLAVVRPIFKRSGIDLVDVYGINGSDDLCYIVRFPDEAARERAWAAFKDDAEWTAAKAASEVDGPLLKSQATTLMTKLS